MKNKFTIDFTEFCFLVEACIPPKPIARTLFWHNVIDKYYYELSEEQRLELFNWITKHPKFNLRDENCRWFYARYCLNRQYLVFTKDEVYNAFKWRGVYYISRKAYILEEYIIKIKKS